MLIDCNANLRQIDNQHKFQIILDLSKIYLYNYKAEQLSQTLLGFVQCNV